MTDAQRMIFNNNLENFLNIIEKEINGNTVENTKNLDLWYKNLCARYKNTITGENPRHHLPQEHIETLEKKLNELGLTLSDLKQSHGKRQELEQILKEKNNKKIENYSLDELETIQQQYDEELSLLEQKHSLRYKKLYSISDEEYTALKIRIKELKIKRKKINEIIEEKRKELKTKIETTQLTTENKSRKQTKYNEKITELMKENSEKNAEIDELRKKLEQLQQARQKDILEYQGDYEKRLAQRKQQLDEEFNKELERKTSMIEINCKRETKKVKEELEEAKKTLEEYKKQKDLELEKQRRILTNQLKNTKERQQQVIVKLLCSADNISLETIKRHLENENIPTECLENSLKELRNMIPGITRVISDEETVYSLRVNAMKQLEQYKNDIVCPRISNVQDGKIEFVVRADLHLDMTNSEDTLKKRLEPFMNYCAKRNNIPIIDLGDLGETIKGIKYKSWKDFDKNTARLAYKFYKNYAKAISSAPEIMHYTLLGNHDEHPYLVGVDPLEILSEYSDNFKSLGISKGSFRIGNDKIGVFHDKQWQNIISYEEYSKEERDEYIYNYLCEEAQSIARDYIYSLFGHYHFGIHNIEKNFSVINNGLECSLLFTAEVKDGYVEKMFVTEVKKPDYKIEIYNRGNQYRK